MLALHGAARYKGFHRCPARQDNAAAPDGNGPGPIS